ncbi:MAG: EF-hand domain-containing protein [Gallionella sp.]|nr:EF-hand domain-containing protein [Gallionella sp.]
MSATISGLGMSHQAMTGASMYMPPAQKMFDLFSQIDTSGTGSISKAQFELAFNTLNPPAGFKAMGSDAVFAQLDPKGTGAVTKQDFKNGMLQIIAQLRQQRNESLTQASTPTPAQTIDTSLDGLNQLGSNIDTTA